MAPLLALLLCARGSAQDRAAAKHLLALDDANRGATRALRELQRALGEPEREQRRLDVHQMPANASAWETLLYALTVHLHSSDKWARASWCQHLLERSAAWHGAGYSWLARQALTLARALSEEHFSTELARNAAALPSAVPTELVLWDLITPTPEWQKALSALAKLSEAELEPAPVGLRVSWFVDMAHAELTRPALQEFRSGQGWSDGRRVTLAELWEQRAALPPEDQRVLDCTRPHPDGTRDFDPDAFEALIAHPRVVNGVRARAFVQVLRGTCRLTTRRERGYVHVSVEPAGAQLGVNVVAEGESRLIVYRLTPAMARVVAALPRGARVPESHERELLAVLGKLSENIEVYSPELGALRTVTADSTPCLRFSSHAGAWLVELGVRPFADQGRFYPAGAGRARVSLYASGQRLSCERDLPLERERKRALCEACPTLRVDPAEPRSPLESEDSWTLGEDAVLGLLAELRDSGLACGLEWPESGGFRLRGHATSSALHGRLRSDKGWYIATGGLKLDEVTEATLSELTWAPSFAAGRFVRLANGDFVEVAARVRRVMAALRAAAPGKRSGAELRLPRSALAALSELSQPDSGFELDRESSEWLERVAHVRAHEPAPPSALRATLRPYQLEGYRWLWQLTELGLGACLADDMGLGKTVQILALLLARAEAGEGPALVVAPTSVCGNWRLELARFAPSLKVGEYLGKDRQLELAKLEATDGAARVLICSYTLLQQDQAALTRLHFGTVVLDEAQFIKNPLSLRARAAFGLSTKARIVATGTPVENHVGDLWSLFRFVNPGLLGDFPHFRRTFLLPIERDGGLDARAALQALIRPFVLRRTKRDVLADLPALTEVELKVELSEEEALRYALLRKQIHDKLYTSHGKRFNKLQVLSEIMRLRRFCCHPSLVFPDAPAECSKVTVFLDLVQELRENQHRALVFSQFVDFLTLLRAELDERGIAYEYLDGSTPPAQRQARVAAFQNGEASLFLISLKAGGFGLNLTAADYVIHLDPWWNPAVQMQATDRAHRIGQEQPVTVYRLVTRDTIEDRIVVLHERKQETARALLDGSDSGEALSPAELLQLLEASA